MQRKFNVYTSFHKEEITYGTDLANQWVNQNKEFKKKDVIV